VSEQTTVTDAFLSDLTQEVREIAEHDAVVMPTAFTRWALDALEDAGEFEEPELAQYEARGLEISGFAFSPDNTAVDLIVTSYRTRRSPETELKATATNSAKRARAFLSKALEGFHSDLEESSSAFDLALELHAVKGDLRSCRVILLSDGLVKSAISPMPDVGDIAVSIEVWDIERIYRLVSSGRRQEMIRVDIQEEFETSWPCLPAPKLDSNGYSVYMALIPGEDLARIYDHYGPRLLELNVRSFLQARGKVNRGIRDTLLNEPGRFLAYNNGITATAGKVRIVEGPDGGAAIAEIEDLQIVNGGQTTASLHRAHLVDAANLDGVMVQAKITVADDLEQLTELVPLISRFSNSQNKVSEADFAANDPYHVKLEELSRTVWAPAVDGGTRQTRWFYERARGQYQDAVGRQRTAAKRKQFRNAHPTQQKLTKTDIAKYEATWRCLPHQVSQGAQKNFLSVQEGLSGGARLEPDERHFHLVVARAILFKSAERIVSDQKLGGYRANIVTYTLSLLNFWTENRIDLEAIWKRQSLPQELAAQIAETSRDVFRVVTAPPGDANISEWAKKEACWNTVREIVRPADSDLWGILAKTRQDDLLLSDQVVTISRESAVVDKMRTVHPEALFSLEVWGMSTQQLDGRERKIVQNVAVAISGESKLARRQAQEGERLLMRSLRQGFSHEGLGLYADEVS
jgi:hypothetical protein